MSDTCRGCGEPILWAIVEGSGRRMPLDLDLVAAGNVEATGRTDPTTGAPIVKVLGKDQAGTPGADRRLSHFASCPQAKTFRRKP